MFQSYGHPAWVAAFGLAVRPERLWLSGSTREAEGDNAGERRLKRNLPGRVNRPAMKVTMRPRTTGRPCGSRRRCQGSG